MLQPQWFRLLEFNRHKRFGLTFPFLIGALRTPPGLVVAGEEANFAELHALLGSMRDHTPHSRYVRIAECDRLRQAVAAPGFLRFRPPGVDRQIPSPAHGVCALYVQPQYIPDEVRGIASVAESLWRECAQAILTGNFSFRNGSFQSFDDADLRFIREAFLAPEDDEA